MELLACIAIIATLGAILIPAVGHVRKKGEAATCASNLRQIGAAFQMYATDNNGVLPLEHSTEAQKLDGKEWYYPNVLATYVPPLEWAAEAQGNARGGVWQCPSIDEETLSWGGGYSTNRSHVILPSADVSNMVYLSQVARPAEIVMIGDGWYASREKTWISMQCPECRSWGKTTEANPIHDGAANMCFLDGHVELIDYEDLAANKNDMFGHHHL
nr:prepilin-type N-terminal cleavage/methylation domain-containing protein [Cerasicoccus maritimus]